MREWLYNLLDHLTDWMVDWMIMLEPRPPRQQTIDYHITPHLPDEVLAVVRSTWYCNGRPVEVTEATVMEDGQIGYDAFATLVTAHAQAGANIGIQSAYAAQDLGIEIE